MFEAWFKSLTAKFNLWNKPYSPSAKSKSAPAMANSGSHSTQQIANGNIYNHQSEKNAIENEESWKDLISCFTKQKAKWFIHEVKNGKLLNLSKVIESFENNIISKFKEINIHSGDPRKKCFVAILDGVRFVIKNYLKLDDADFEAKWMLFGDQLISLKNDES